MKLLEITADYTDMDYFYVVNIGEKDCNIFDNYIEARANFEQEKANECKARKSGARSRKIELIYQDESETYEIVDEYV